MDICKGITSASVFKNILMQGLQINTFIHGIHTLITHPKLQIINYSNIRLHSIVYHNFGERILCPLIRFRLSNHNLPMETGRWKNVTIQNRICVVCNDFDIGD